MLRPGRLMADGSQCSRSTYRSSSFCWMPVTYQSGGILGKRSPPEFSGHRTRSICFCGGRASVVSRADISARFRLWMLNPEKGCRSRVRGAGSTGWLQDGWAAFPVPSPGLPGRFTIVERCLREIMALVSTMQTTRLSTKGQIVLPRSIRASRAWGPGTEFSIEETKDGILLRPASLFPRTCLDQVAGCLRSRRRKATIAEMDRSILREVTRLYNSGRH